VGAPSGARKEGEKVKKILYFGMKIVFEIVMILAWKLSWEEKSEKILYFGMKIVFEIVMILAWKLSRGDVGKGRQR